MNGKEIELPAPSEDRESGSEEPKETCTLSVCHFEPKRTRVKTGQEQTCSANLYVKNFPSRVERVSADGSDA